VQPQSKACETAFRELRNNLAGVVAVVAKQYCRESEIISQSAGQTLTGKHTLCMMASSNGIRANAWVILRLASDQMKAVEVKPNT
jgi:hypothetical protein